MLPELTTAIRTLTILPIPGREAENPAASLPYFPLVGCLLGLCLWAAGLLGNLIPGNGWPAGVAGLMVAAHIVLTRALHLDGLADLVDAIGGSWDKHERLAIMKDSHLGVFGAIAVALVLLLKWLAFARMVAGGTTLWLVLIFAIARAIQVDLAVQLPYARAEGGTASSFVEAATSRHRYSALGFTLVLAVVFGPPGVVLFTVAVTVSRLYGRWCGKRLGGISGDMLGAANELVETALFMLLAALGPTVTTYSSWEIFAN
ncbi:MAG: adenosylcobinamide-GDP ribazoletransferase [Deltaproteobacteria bacterium]|nr:adenosylcobinamide-GDP ribazoletransferase [Deltaproteobacteria bacterium]MBW2071535.1 adenosylcobinamide-GDP ribazoletransferase [Deltaproteobacteria bacterium]